MISDLFSLRRLDDLATRTHSEGINELAAAALIEQEGRFLLIEKPSRNCELAPSTWELLTGFVRAGETLTSGMERVLAEYFGFSSAEVTRYLGHNDHADDGASSVSWSSQSPSSTLTASATPLTSDTAGSTTLRSPTPSTPSIPSSACTTRPPRLTATDLQGPTT
ncbi:NUDIX hydrolase [Streptomyces spiralis]